MDNLFLGVPLVLVRNIVCLFLTSLVFNNLFLKKDIISIIYCAFLVTLVSSILILSRRSLSKMIFKDSGESSVKILDKDGKEISSKTSINKEKFVFGLISLVFHFVVLFFIFNLSGVVKVEFLDYIYLFFFFSAIGIPLSVIFTLINKAYTNK